MLKFTSLVLCLTVLTTACQTQTPGEGTELGDSLEGKTAEEIQLEPSTRANMVASSDSILVDNTGYGFAYDASNVLDQDYSTSWCRGAVSAEDGPFAGGLTLTFTESPAGKTMGIVPGFARDEDTYFQNNRVKTLALVDSASPLLEDATTFELEDSYEMQFITLPEDVDESFMLFVSDVYPGTKYNDTCIAEIDLWSDWVETRDAEAAYDYYLETKEAYAKRPTGIADLGLIFTDDYEGISPDDVTLSCGAIDTAKVSKVEATGKDELSAGFTYTYSDGTYLGGYTHFAGKTEAFEWSAWSGMTPVLSAKLNTSAREGDRFDIKWIQNSFWQTLEEPKLLRTQTVEASRCDDGTLYISDSLGGVSLGGYEVEVYYNGKLVGETEFSLAQ